MGKDINYSYHAVTIPYLGKLHLFHIIDNDFPLPEEGIIGMPFLNAFDRYIITKDFLYIDNKKLPLYEDGTFVSGNTAQVTTILDTTTFRI